MRGELAVNEIAATSVDFIQVYSNVDPHRFQVAEIASEDHFQDALLVNNLVPDFIQVRFVAPLRRRGPAGGQRPVLNQGRAAANDGLFRRWT